MSCKKIILSILLFFAGAGVAAEIFLWREKYQKPPFGKPSGLSSPVTSFEECVKAGYPIKESYPRQCRTNGITFTENIGNEAEKTHLIRIASPRPNAVIVSPVEITGEARGYWFFEANFPLELQDEAGNILAVGIAQAQDEWMTEAFVPFKATLNFSIPQSAATKHGTLILRKDNPSGIPEYDDALLVPVAFR